MDLIFLGRGAAFNPKEGNNSAYFIENNELFLIDCGETVFSKLIMDNVINDIDEINVMITHTHSDHIGSLGALVMYSYYNMHKPINIILPSNAKYFDNIEKILSGFGCNMNMYNYINEKEYDNRYCAFQNMRFIETDHCDELDCYGILFNTESGIVYYSGDTREINSVKALISSGQKIDKIYMDTTSSNYPGNVHLYIGILNAEIPTNIKRKIYCMHINDDKCISLIDKYGFNIVKVKQSINYKK